MKLVYAVKVRITGDPSHELKPGMPADVVLEAAPERVTARRPRSRLRGLVRAASARLARGRRPDVRRCVAGELFGLVGPDGAGKTTTLRMLAGVLPPSAGDALVLGASVAREPERVKRHLAYMSQRFGLYGDLTVRENLDVLRRPLRGAARPSGPRASSGSTASPNLEPFRGPARRQALRRHEAEARAVVRPHPRAARAAARRADVRRRPGLAPRPVDHRPRDGARAA